MQTGQHSAVPALMPSHFLFRIILRVALLLCLAAAAISLLADSMEYPGVTRAGTLIALRQLLPLAIVGWLNLGVLLATGDSPETSRARVWFACAGAANLALLVRTLPDARRGAAPLSLALPVIAALLLIGVIGVALTVRNPSKA